MSLRDKFLKDFNLISTSHKENISVVGVLNDRDVLGISYFELNRASNDLREYFLKIFGKKPQYIGVSLTDYFLLPCIILAIWKCGSCFAGVSSQYTKKNTTDFLNFLGVKYLITDSTNDYDGDLICYFLIGRWKFFIWGRGCEELEREFIENISYGIMTSGSTGEPKIIQVPWSCILPNAVELIELFQVTELDCIFQSSPYSFDPFFIELFLVFLTGCSLMVVSSNNKLYPSELLKILFCKNEIDNLKLEPLQFQYSESQTYIKIQIQHLKKRNISILQMTPSIFTRWSDKEIKEFILSPTSELRILVLGGENFPKKLLKLKSCDNNTKIYNIYGITEISCWSFLNDVTNFSPDDEISVGKPLNDIIYKIQDSELLIGSNVRICILNEEKYSELERPVFRKTGDIVKVHNNEIYYLCRNNQIVKKYGMKINLTKISDVIMRNNNSVIECHCVYDKENLKLGCFYVCNKTTANNENYKVKTFQDFHKEYKILKNDLKDIELPDYFIEVTQIPLNSHGKCDSQQLLQYLKNIKFEPPKSELEDAFRKLWMNILDIKQHFESSLSFIELGGNSVLGLTLINRLEDEGFCVPQEFISILLGGESYENCLKCLKLDVEKCESPRKKVKISSESSDIQLVRRWKFDLEKCVDASPAIFAFQGKERIVIGSHSSKLSCIQLDSGGELWTRFLGGRIQSDFRPTKDGSKGFIGCYDHFVYAIAVLDGSIIWKFETGDVVKSTPCLSSNEQILYAASYDKTLYCLSAADGKVTASLKLSNGGIFSSGIISNSLGSFFIGTLDNVCVAISQKTNQPIWKTNLESPIFTSPCLIPEKPEIIFSEVLGYLHCFNALNGTKLWTFKANGNIYSSPILQNLNGINHIVFGCHDACFYCLRYEKEPELKWKQQMVSSVFAKPVIISNSLLCAATTKGSITLCDFGSGSIRSQIQLDGEVFSSPVYYNNRIVVGCRDNYVYCLDLNESNV